ncbi:MAG: glycosyltransferase [Oligoflexales bacterium]
MNYNPRIDQILPTFGKYDAIGIDALNMRDLIRARGFESDIFAEDGPMQGTYRHLSEYESCDAKGNLLIHHFSIGSMIPYYLTGLASTKITRYHNITPAKYFPYEHTSLARIKCNQGRQQIPLIKDLSDYYWAASRYNASELDEYNFKNGSVIPLINNYKKLRDLKPCAKVTDILQKDKRKTILFVGRVAPNKAHHDLLFLLNQYRKFINEDIRLICVGKMENYYGRILLKNLASEWGLRISNCKPYNVHSDVLFTGPVNEHELVSFYRNADVFVCMSAHEGFCAPLVEAMNFGLPVLAHKAAAVPETLNQAGLLVDKNDPIETLNGLAKLLNDSDTNSKWSSLAYQRADDFDWDIIKTQFYSQLDLILNEI